MGYKVTIYDGQERVGGTYRDGIPWDKYDKGYLDEMKTLLEGMGVEFKMNTRVGNKAGEVSTETLESQHDVVVVATGVIHKPRKMPVENGEGNIMDAMTYLHAQNKWLDQFHERKKTEPELTIQQYEAETPFELSTKGRTVLVFGKGYTGYDIIRLTSRDMCADGDPTKMDGKILWVNRRIEGDGPLAYPDNTFDDKSDPSMMMFAHLEKLHPSQAEKQFLLEPKEIKTNADGKIIEVVFYQKEITNPLVAEKFPDRAIYKTLEETVTKTFSPEENVLIIAAAGFDKSRPDALFQSLGIADENKMATTTGSYTKRNGYFVAGDVSPNCKSEVVHTFKSADDTANEVDRYLQQKAANRTEAIPRGFVAQDTWDSMAKESVMEKAREHLSHLPPGPKTVCGCNAVA
jgi:NADPH-dependent glutamate synthase beta subunit-like oxidoreductase